MIGAVYMANTISVHWSRMATTFNLAMMVMLMSVATMYFIQICLKRQDTGAAKNSFLILCIDIGLYLIAFIVSLTAWKAGVMYLDIAAVLVGAFLPFFIRGHFDIRIISFPHLMERFELITIITFGEAVVGMTDYFDVSRFTFQPVLVFMIILLLFGCYVTQIHRLCNHEQSERALRLMFSHYFIVIAVNLMTVAFKFLENTKANRLFTAMIMLSAIMIFFIALYANSAYYDAKYCFTGKDRIQAFIAILFGGTIMLLLRNNTYDFLIGILIITIGNLLILTNKYYTAQRS